MDSSPSVSPSEHSPSLLVDLELEDPFQELQNSPQPSEATNEEEKDEDDLDQMPELDKVENEQTEEDHPIPYKPQEPYVHPSTETYVSYQQSVVSTDQLMEMMIMMNDNIQNHFKEISDFLKSIDVKRIKRKRTDINRCKYINKNGKQCLGYCCKVSTTMCYAHHIKIRSGVSNFKKTPTIQYVRNKVVSSKNK